MTDKPTALGVEMKGEIPPGYLVSDVLLIAKVIDEEGDPALIQMASPALRTWEAAGMAVALLDSLRDGLRDMFQPDEDE